MAYIYTKELKHPAECHCILDDDLFYRVQALMNKNKSAPARTRGENEYLLTTKLFCGHCKEMMVGYGGTGKSGKQYHCYMCKRARKKKCDKKIVSKDYIENRAISECLKMLTDDKIRYIAKKVAEECNKSPDNVSVREIKKAIKEVDTAIENLWKGIEQGQAVVMLTERLNQRQAEKAELETQLAIENNKKICLSEAQILAFLNYVCEMPMDDFHKRRAIINIFVHSIYLYDDHFTLIINASKKPLSIDNIPLNDIEAVFEGKNSETGGCSSLMTPAPPCRRGRHIVRSDVFLFRAAMPPCMLSAPAFLERALACYAGVFLSENTVLAATVCKRTCGVSAALFLGEFISLFACGYFLYTPCPQKVYFIEVGVYLHHDGEFLKAVFFCA